MWYVECRYLTQENGSVLVKYCGNALNRDFSDNFQYSTIFLSVILKLYYLMLVL